MGEYNTYYVCHGGEELPMGYTTNTCVSCMKGWLHMMADTFMYVAVTLN